MFQAIIPKLPMRNKLFTKYFYIDKLGFINVGIEDFESYLILEKDHLQIHFFEYRDLNPLENYGQIYIRTQNIDQLYQSLLEKHIEIHPNGKLTIKPWHQKEFSLLDPDHNLLTFGQYIHDF